MSKIVGSLAAVVGIVLIALPTRQAGSAAGGGITLRIAAPPAISSVKVLPMTSFEVLAGGHEIDLSAAPGEYEPGTFVVRNESGAPVEVHLDVGGLEAKNGRAIPRDAVDLKHVLVWYQASGAWTHWRRLPRNMDAFLTPELLVNDPALIRVDREARHNYLRLSKPSGPEYLLVSERRRANGNVYPTIEERPVYDSPILLPVVIPPGENRQFWVTVHVPLAQEAGTYEGAIRVLNGADRELASVPLRLRVHGFELPPPRLEYSIYYRGKLADHHPTVSHEWKSSAQLEADLASMVEHGISNPNIYQRVRIKEEVEGASPITGREALERVLEIRERLGITGWPIYSMGLATGRDTNPRRLAGLQSDIEFVRSLARTYGATDVYAYGPDEAGGALLEAQRFAWRAVKDAGGKVFAAGYGDHFERTNGMTDLLVYSNPPIPDGREVAAKQRRVGNRTFMYGNPQAGPEDPLLWRRNFGILVWQAGYDGVMPFAFQSQFGDMWNDWDDKHYRTEALAYPAADKPISTLAFEGLREAVDDVRYLTALENAIYRAEQGTPSEPQQIALAGAQGFLAELRTGENFDPAQVRSQVALWLSRLAK